MEIHLLMMVWITALVFTVLSYYARNNHAFPVIAAVGWIVTAYSFVHVQIIGFDSMGNGSPYTLLASMDMSKAGQLGSVLYFAMIGVGLMMMTAGWVMSGRRVGDDV